MFDSLQRKAGGDQSPAGGHGHPVSRRRRPGAMRSVAANGTVTVAGQQLRVGRTYAGQTVAISTDDTVFRVLHNAV